MERDLLALLRDKVVVFDGAMGTSLQAFELGLDDFEGLEGCNEVLVQTRPDVVREVHDAFLQAGVDVVETNSFGSNAVVLAEYGIAERAYDLSRRSAALARSVADDHSTPSRPRLVCGSIGPGTRLPSLGHMAFGPLRDAFLPQAAGLIDGGADALIVETCQDPLQIKAAFAAVRRACAERQRTVPVLLSVTIEAPGTMLVGMDLEAALAALLPLGPISFGLNCATGPETMKRHLGRLSAWGPRHLSAMPNAGLPRREGGRFVYSLGPDEFAQWVAGFVRDEGVGIVGGCCGTRAEHLRALVERVGGLAAPQRQAAARPAAASSLYGATPLRQEPAPLMVGERLNANGSRAFRRLLLAGDREGMLQLARDQEASGAHMLDVCVAYVGRDEAADLGPLVGDLARQARVPLMLDSTDPVALEAALQQHGGRCVINSINLEAGEAPARRVLDLAQRYGAAVVSLTIDEQGMAMTVERKLAVAERLLALAVDEHGLRPADLVFDMLTFTVGSGDEELRAAALHTLEAITTFKRRHPETQTILGVSNVSFGLARGLRRWINSVFLALAVEHGLDMAIVNVANILPLHRIPADAATLCRRLLLNDRSEGDPLTELLQEHSDAGRGPTEEEAARIEQLPAEQRLHRRVIDGSRKGLDELLAELLAAGRAPVAVINELLIPAMREVGRLFGAGQMQLPFVLQSAQVMKDAVARLEPHMEAGAQRHNGTFVIATVRGDVHDIGKNLVDIILSNNGYRVINLGIKVELEQMLAAVQEHGADALGMSGLLVKSTVVMRENLEEMARRGVRVPVLLGGAALTRRYVEEDLRAVYGPQVHYAQDAFEGLAVLDALVAAEPAVEAASEPPTASAADTPAAVVAVAATDPGTPTAGDPLPVIDHSVPVPTAPAWGARVISPLPVAELLPLINETALFRGRWRYRRGELSRDEHAALVEREVRPVLADLSEQALRGDLVAPAAVLGYFPCWSEGQDVVVLDSATGSPRARLSFPRRHSAPRSCIADYFRPGPTDTPDLLGLFVTTLGGAVAERIQRLFEADEYRDYLHLHGFATELADACAEWAHLRMRAELGLLESTPLDAQELVRQGYRGSRYSFGYPACPDLAQQQALFELLEPARIGLSLSETFQMVPEHAVSAVVVHHPQAKYFNLD